METQMKKKLQASEKPKNNVFPNLYYIYTFYTNPGTAIKAIILKKNKNNNICQTLIIINIRKRG